MEQKPGYFEILWMVLWRWIQSSLVYRGLRRMYDAIAGAWQRSRITGWFRRQHLSDGTIDQSLAGRIFGWPFGLTGRISKRFGGRWEEAVQNSGILRCCRLYLENMLALNLRFLGFILLGCGVGSCLGSLAAGNGPSLPWIAVALLGGVVSFLDGNVTDWLGQSRLIGFLCRCLGLTPDFHWYDKDLTAGRSRLAIGGLWGLLCGLLGGLTHPLLGVALLPGLAAVFLIVRRPLAGVFMLVFLAPLAPTMAMAGLAILTFLSLVVKSVTCQDFRLRYDGLGFLLLAFIVVYLLAGIGSFARAKSLSIWAIYAVFMAAYFLIINLVENRKQLRHLLVTFVFSGLLVCLYGIAQYLFGWDTAQAWMDEEMFSDIKMRIYSTLENPNVLGEYILLVLPAAVGMMWTGKGIWQKLTYAGIAAVLFGALILTFSRGCWIGLLLAAAIFITFAAGKLWGLGLLVLPLLPALLPESIINRFASIGDMKDSSTSYRVYIWMGTLAMVRDFWIFGIGMGAEAFGAVYPFYSYNGIVAPHAHNLFLQILVESGIVGIGVFGLILLLFFKRMMTGYQWGGGKGAELSTWVVALSAGVSGFLLQGMFDNCFYNYRVMLIFWMVLGMAMACTYLAKEKQQKEEEI